MHNYNTILTDTRETPLCLLFDLNLSCVYWQRQCVPWSMTHDQYPSHMLHIARIKLLFLILFCIYYNCMSLLGQVTVSDRNIELIFRAKSNITTDLLWLCHILYLGHHHFHCNVSMETAFLTVLKLSEKMMMSRVWNSSWLQKVNNHLLIIFIDIIRAIYNPRAFKLY